MTNQTPMLQGVRVPLIITDNEMYVSPASKDFIEKYIEEVINASWVQSVINESFVRDIVREEIRAVELADQGWIVPPWENEWIGLGWGLFQVAVRIKGQNNVYQGNVCRNIFLDADGGLWIASGTRVFRSAPLDKIDIASRFTDITGRYIVNVTTDEGRLALGKRDGNWQYFMVSWDNGSWWSQGIYRILADWEETVAEEVARCDLWARPYDMNWDGRYNHWVVPSYETFYDSKYHYYIIDEDGSIKDHYETYYYPGQQIAIDKYGDYWINARGSKTVNRFEKGTLNLVTSYSHAVASEIRGVGEDISGNLVFADLGAPQVIVRLAEADYSTYSVIRLSGKTYKACPAGEGVFVSGFDTNIVYLVYPDYGVVKTIPLRSTRVPYGQGDCGLCRYKVWGWNWSPDVKALQKFVKGYVEENTS